MLPMLETDYMKKETFLKKPGTTSSKCSKNHVVKDREVRL
jgi:hypothetical protein